MMPACLLACLFTWMKAKAMKVIEVEKACLERDIGYRIWDMGYVYAVPLLFVP